jgi:hypothetical protein
MKDLLGMKDVGRGITTSETLTHESRPETTRNGLAGAVYARLGCQIPGQSRPSLELQLLFGDHQLGR